MIARFRTWFDGRSVREKWMVLAMLALLAITIVWGVTRPLGEALSSARERNNDAGVRLAQTQGQVDAVKALRRGRPTAAAGPIEDVVRQSAATAGFTLDAVTPDGPRLKVHINSARGGALLAWLGDLEAQGVLVDDLNASDNGSQAVSADISFKRVAA
jgi:general secretion pathway protein M